MISLEILKHPNIKVNNKKFFIFACWWKLNQLFLKVPVIVELTKKVRCICYPHSSYSGLVACTRLPEFYEMNFLLNYLKDDSIFVDVGANIGIYSLLAADKIKKGRICAFEVAQEPLNIFYENIYINKFGSLIQITEKAVSDKDGIENFRFEKISEVGRLSENAIGGNKVQVVRLDTFLKKEKIKEIDLLKIDVEGAEAKVLEGLGECLNRNQIKSLIVEINPNIYLYGNDPMDILTLLKEKGYNIFMCKKDYSISSLKNFSSLSFKRTFDIICVSDKEGLNAINNINV